jgi:hypothetical protein
MSGAHKRRFVAWAVAGVLSLLAGLAWPLVVGYGSVDWPDVVQPWIRYTKPLVVLGIVGAAACFVRAANSYRSSRT